MSADVFNILMVGVGGQGIILASDIVARAALLSGLDAKKSEIHGMSQRGGSVFSHIRFGPKVHSPLIPEGEADILFSLEEMEALRWLAYANQDSAVIVLKNRVKPAEVEEYPLGIEEELRRCCPSLLLLDGEKLQEELGEARFLNVALLGVLAQKLDLSEEAWKKAIEEEVPKGTAEANWKAFQVGRRH